MQKHTNLLLEKQYSRTLTTIQFDPETDRNKKIDLWVFDDQSSRQAVQQKWRDLGLDITIHAAYKPLLHTLLETLQQPEETGKYESITVYYPIHPLASEKRFLLECYPIASCLPHIAFHFEPLNHASDKFSTESSSSYWISAKQKNGEVKEWPIFAPNRVKTDHTNTDNLSACGWLTIQDKLNNNVLKNEPILTEYEAIFDDLLLVVKDNAQQRLKMLSDSGQLAIRPLFFEKLKLSLTLPCKEIPLNVGEEIVSYQEAMHEEIYFSLIELLQAEAKPYIGSGAERTLQVGQIVPDILFSQGDIHLKVTISSFESLEPFEVNKFEATKEGKHSEKFDLSRLERVSSPLPKMQIDNLLHTISQAVNVGRVVHYHAKSVLGNQINGLYISGSDHPLLISGAQHANETSGTIGALRAIQQLISKPNCHFAVAPIENPDGYALHQYYIKDNPFHIHHAARYTALGDDLEYRDSEPLYEKGIRKAAIDTNQHSNQNINQHNDQLKGFQLHVNLHGYPSHEWTRPLTGYIPRGFDLWTIPKGFFLIVRHHASWQAQARALIEAITLDLMQNSELVTFNTTQIQRYETYAGELPFELINGFPCLISIDERHEIPITLITEYPDETIHGEPFIAAHTAQMQTVISAYQHWQTLLMNRSL